MPSTASHSSLLLRSLIILSLLSSLILASPSTHRVHARLPFLPILSDRQISPESVPLPKVLASPIDSFTCGYARTTQVGVSVNKGAKATLRYKIRVRAISAQTLAFSDTPFQNALSEPHLSLYMSMRDAYSGGLDIPFLQFLGVDLSDPHGRGNASSSLNDDEFRKLSQIAQEILTEATKQIIQVKGKLKATGISCMKTTAFAFIKIAKVDISKGQTLTVLNTKNDDLMAATKHADTMLPSSGSVKVKNAKNDGKKLTLLNPDVDDVSQILSSI